MRRSEFKLLTGLKASAIDNLVRRDEFPFLRQALENKTGWGDYSPRLVFMTALALGLAETGTTLERAGRFVNVEYQELLAERSIDEVMSGQILFGFAYWGSSNFEPEEARRVRFSLQWPLCGSYPEISESLTALSQSDPSSELFGLVLVNASERLRFLKAKAADQGLSATIAQSVFSPEVTA